MKDYDGDWEGCADDRVRQALEHGRLGSHTPDLLRRFGYGYDGYRTSSAPPMSGGDRAELASPERATYCPSRN
jgi:hypothetical protein